MEIFNKNHVLVANDVATATVMDLKLDSEVYEEVAEYQSHHGTSKAQAAATTQEFSRDEFVLRNSMILHHEPHDLFMITGLFTRDAKPSKSLMNFLRAIERDIKIKIVDWRSLIAITSNRRRVKECLSNTYERSAQSGYMTTLAPRKFIIFIRNHLAETENGEEWRPMVNMFREPLDAIMKEHSSDVQKPSAKERSDTSPRSARTTLRELSSKRRC